MPPRPFPLPLAIGADVCHRERFLKYIPSSFPTTDPRFKPKQTQKLDRYHDATRDAATVPGIEPVSRLPKALFRLLDRTLTPTEQRLFWQRWGSVRCLGFDAQETTLSTGKKSGQVVRGNWSRGTAQDGKGSGGKRGEANVNMLGADNKDSVAEEGRFERDRTQVARWLAGRWAAKEAIIKAYSTMRPKLFMRDIEIHTHPSTGAPFGIVLDTRGQPSLASRAELPSEHVVPATETQSTRSPFAQQPTGDAHPIAQVGSPGPQEVVPRSRPGVVQIKSWHIWAKWKISDYEANKKKAEAIRSEQRAKKEERLEGLKLWSVRHARRQSDEDDTSMSIQSSETNGARKEFAENDDAAIHDAEEENNADNNRGGISASGPKQYINKDGTFEIDGLIKNLKLEQSREPDMAAEVANESEPEEPWRHIEGQIVQVSISHDGEYIFATALAPTA